MPTQRTSWQVTRSVWFALFMREALTRTTGERMGAFWVLAEPILITGIMVSMRSALFGSNRHFAGVEFIPWIVVGLLTFSMMRDLIMRSIGAIEANKALFAYRQVKPIDTVLARVFVETLLATFLLMLFLLILALLGFRMLPEQPLAAMFIWFSAVIFGLGGGLVTSVCSALIPEIGKVLRMLTLPMMLLSGAFMPINNLPRPIADYLLFNPMVHVIESFRATFFDTYHTLPQISMTYFLKWTLSLLLLGVTLHLRFEMKLKRK